MDRKKKAGKILLVHPSRLAASGTVQAHVAGGNLALQARINLWNVKLNAGDPLRERRYSAKAATVWKRFASRYDKRPAACRYHPTCALKWRLRSAQTFPMCVYTSDTKQRRWAQLPTPGAQTFTSLPVNTIPTLCKDKSCSVTNCGTSCNSNKDALGTRSAAASPWSRTTRSKPKPIAWEPKRL